MNLQLLFAGFVFTALTFSARSESVYDRPPAYDVKMQLQDAWSLGELVVQGTSGKRTIAVEQVLFGKSAELTETKHDIAMGSTPGIASGIRGVWFLVKGPDGYVSVNPGGKAISLETFKALPSPATHWTTQKGLTVNQPDKRHLNHCYVKPETKDPVRHGPWVFLTPIDVEVGLFLHGEQEFSLKLDSMGCIKRINRYPKVGYGFYLEYDNYDRLVEFGHFNDRKRHGLYRRYYADDPDQLREEKQFTNGVVDGRWRKWNEKGEIIYDQTFEMGLVPPVVHYQGKEPGPIVIRRDENGATYSMHPVVNGIKVGMTVQEVSDLLKVDFSPTGGLMFLFYQRDQYLSVSFKDGKVSVLHTGHNGVCLGLRRDMN